MSKVYKHKPLALDEVLGRVEPDGKVYESRLGPDKYIGRVDIATGKIYETRLGPDRQVGRVELDTGKVYRSRLGPDEYLGRVDGSGKCRVHKPLAIDEYVGGIRDMVSYAHGGAAFLLLLLPAMEENPSAGDEKST